MAGCSTRLQAHLHFRQSQQDKHADVAVQAPIGGIEHGHLATREEGRTSGGSVSGWARSEEGGVALR